MRFSHLSGALRIVLGMFAGVFLYSQFGPEPEPQYREVIVTQKQIETVEKVDTIIKWRERIVYRTVKAERVATAPGGAVTDVERFCGPAEPEGGDAPTEAPISQPPALLLRSVRQEDAWFFGRDKVVLTGPLSNGDLRQLTYRTRDGFQAIVHGDSTIVQYPRTALVKQGIEAAVFVGLGYLIGRF